MNTLLELNNEDLSKVPTLIKTLVQQKSPTSETQKRGEMMTHQKNELMDTNQQPIGLLQHTKLIENDYWHENNH